MNTRDLEPQPDAAEAAWRKFVEHDARMEAPSELEGRTVAGWLSPGARGRVAPRSRRPRLLWPFGAAAAIVVVALAVRIVDDTRVRVGPVRSTAPAAARVTSQPALLLAVDPIRDTETMQIVRVRMPRSALRAVGLVVGEHGDESVVELEVLVGEDGLARGVRRVAAVKESR